MGMHSRARSTSRVVVLGSGAVASVYNVAMTGMTGGVGSKERRLTWLVRRPIDYYEKKLP